MIPATKENITLDWLNQALGGHLSAGNRVIAVTVSDGSSGRGFTGQVLKLGLEYSQADRGPKSLILKIPLDMDNTIKAQMYPFNRNELKWYTDLGVSCPVRIPICYFADEDQNSSMTCLLLEDLSKLEAVPPTKGLSPDHAELAVYSLAHLHSHFWGRDTLKINEISSLGEKLDNLVASIKVGWEHAINLYSDFLDQNFHNMKEAYIKTLQKLRSDSPSKIKTLIHGDYKVDNLLFDVGSETEVVLLDWQGIGMGFGVEELAGFIPRSLSIKNRQRSEVRLLRIYHQALLTAGVDINNFEGFQREYSMGLLTSLATNIGFSAKLVSGELSDGNSERDKQMNDYNRLITQRKYAAVVDNNALQLLC